ncbi:MAG: T9SS type A sorting domain-containing protein [Chitinophagales bacterium]|nr:T9SS type A sorting domain-containing protein [Chitinophagales bacterium]
MRYLVLLLLIFSNVSLFASNANGELLRQLSSVNAQWSKQPEHLSVVQQAGAFNNVNFNQWIATHLMLVEKTLRAREVSHLTPSQKQNRFKLLNELNGYWKEGVFPVNDYLPYKNPVFIDKKGTHCAVGYLMMQSGYDALAQMIDANEKFAYVYEIKTTGVAQWANEHGFTVDELAWIQPGYPPNIQTDDLDGGLDGTVNTIAVDGGSQVVYVGGSFNHSISGVTCNNVAAWISGFAGWDWVPVGNGVNGPVYAMLLHNNKLYVGGKFTTAGSVAATNIAVYDIAQGQWQAIGSLDSTVRAFAVYNNELYAGGDFTGFVSKWNGSTWTDVTQGFLYGEGVRTLEVWNNELVIGGNFELATGALRRHVATYNGTYMGMLGMGTLTPVNDFTEHDGKLYAATDLYYMNDSSGLCYFDENANNWITELKPYFGMFDGFSGAAVKKLISTGNHLLAAGEFGCTGGMTYGNNLMSVQKVTYDTTTYTVTNPLLLTDNEVNDIALSGNTLYFGGSFVTNLFSDTLNHIGTMQFQITGVQNPIESKVTLSVFPNPASAEVRIQSLNNGIIELIEVFDATGRKVLSEQVNNESFKVIRLSSLSSGIYTVKVLVNGAVGVSKLVKQ